MNLHGIVGPIIAAVNPMVAAIYRASAGYTQDASFKQVPAYAADVPVRAQVQALTWRDLQQIDGINLAGLRRGIYLFGNVESVDRQAVKGGDLILFGSTAPAPLTSTTWLVALQLEGWGATAADAWCKVAAVLQND